MPRPPFDMLRACFWLMAVIILVMVGAAGSAAIGCGYLVLTGQQKLGACLDAGVTGQAREVLELSLTTVLALLLAARGPRPPDDDNAPHG
jgi:hypothetical protein